MFDTAYNLIQEGFGAIPLKDSKAPLLPVGHNYLYELINENNIDKLFLKAEKIGIACGYVSDGFECIDFDAHNSEPIRRIFNNFMKDSGVSTIIEMNDLPIVKTPSGGYHIYYRCDVIEQGRSLALWESGSVMIETRGNGQYVCTLPSNGYDLISGSELIKLARITPDQRDYLLSKCEDFNKLVKTVEKSNGKSTWPTKFDITTAWGKFNEEGIEETKELLIKEGWEFVRIRKHDDVEMWMRPGKEYKNEQSKPVSATLGKLHNMFYCFTDSTQFEQRVGYTFFDVLMLLKFEGDKVKTIKYLEKKYNIFHYKSAVSKKTVDFPINVFPELIQNYINEQNKISNFDKNLMSSTFLWLMATLIGNRFSTFVNDNWDVSPVVWLMIIAERGSTKTHAINAIIRPAKKLDSKSRKEFEMALKEYDPDDKESKAPVWKQIFLEDGTREGYIKALSHNPGGLGLMKDELTGWVADMDRHSSGKGGDEAFWLSSFNNSSYTKNIKGDDGSHIDRMFINLAGSIQPGVIDEMVKKHSINGLFDRFLLVPYIETEFTFSMDIPEITSFNDYEKFVQDSHGILKMFPDGGGFRFEDDSKIEFESAYNKFLKIKYQEHNDQIKAYISKIITYLPRLCLVVELTDQLYARSLDGGYLDPKIRIYSVIKAFDVLKYFLNNARNVLFDIGEKMEMINIIKSTGSVKKSDKVRDLLNAVEAGEIKLTQADIGRFVGMSKQQVNSISKQKVNTSKN